MKTPTLLAALAALAAAMPARAAEFRASYGEWAFDISGTAKENGQVYDFERDLDAHRDARRSLAAEWDTGPGWWKPDLAFGDARIGVSGSHTGTALTGLPPPLPQTTSRTVSVQGDFTDQDYVARYPLSSGALKLSAGLALKRLSGTVVIDDSSQSQPSRGEFDATVPELHTQLRYAADTWFTVQATAQGVQYQDNSAFEWRAGLEFTGLAPLLLDASWQQKRYDITVNGDALDVSLSGALLRAGFVLR